MDRDDWNERAIPTIPSQRRPGSNETWTADAARQLPRQSDPRDTDHRTHPAPTAPALPPRDDRMTPGTITEADMIDAIRLQLTTWAPGALGVTIPDTIDTTTDLRDLVSHVAKKAQEEWGEYDDDESMWGIAHLTDAEADATSAAHGRDTRHLLSTLTSLILAARALY